jgi:hypothetical protein
VNDYGALLNSRATAPAQTARHALGLKLPDRFTQRYVQHSDHALRAPGATTQRPDHALRAPGPPPPLIVAHMGQ